MLHEIRSAVLLIYVVITGALLGADLIWLNSSWNGQRQAIGQKLIADASLVNSVIQSNLIDASKLLDFARVRLIEAYERRPPNSEAIHKILDGTLKSVSFSVSRDLRGLLFFIDPQARMVAQSGQFPAPVHDFSERLYYRRLMAEPAAKFAVGNMLVAKTTGQLVFHISMPVRSEKGDLLGILVQQIRVHDVANLIAEFLENPGAVIVTRLPDNKIAFVFPPEATPPTVGEHVCGKGSEKGFFVASATPEAGERLLAGYAFSSLFNMCTAATLPEGFAFARFLKEHVAEVIGLSLAFLLTTTLFVVLLSLVRRLDEEIELSNRDALTGLRNRRFLDAVYENYCRDSIRNGNYLSVLFLDLDHFKAVNDSYGHAVGDLVLKSLGEVLQDHVRRPLDVCCRWGGEEFVVLLPETDLEGALAVATEIRDDLRTHGVQKDAIRLQSITVSIGVVSRILRSDTAADDLVALADKAMLKAKAQGRDRIVVYED